MNGISIAFVIHSVDSTTNRKNGHPHTGRLENAKKDRLDL
jgi:hypothetical protein